MKRHLGSVPGLSDRLHPAARAVIGSPLWAAALGMLLAGCAEMAPPGTTTVRVEPRPDAEPPPARGETQLVVRAVAADAPGREIPGAVCDAVSPYFASHFPRLRGC